MDMIYAVAKLKQEDVFKSISQNVSGQSNPKVLYTILLAIAVIILLVVLLNSFKQRQGRPKAVNHTGKLLKEMLKRVPMRKAEVRALKVIAAEQGCDSPLTLVLCPSLLAKGINAKGKADRKSALMVARKMGLTTTPRREK